MLKYAYFMMGSKLAWPGWCDARVGALGVEKLRMGVFQLILGGNKLKPCRVSPQCKLGHPRTKFLHL